MCVCVSHLCVRVYVCANQKKTKGTPREDEQAHRTKKKPQKKKSVHFRLGFSSLTQAQGKEKKKKKKKKQQQREGERGCTLMSDSPRHPSLKLVSATKPPKKRLKVVKVFPIFFIIFKVLVQISPTFNFLIGERGIRIMKFELEFGGVHANEKMEK